jgi:NAD(P)H-nitrite reductase large subunit
MRYLIIGNSAAGISAAKAIRRRDKNGAIVIFSEEPYPYYSRLLVTHLIMGNVSRYQLFEGTKKLLHEYNLDTRLKTEIVEVHPHKNRIICRKGHQFSFDKLLIATGSSPVVPEVPGKNLPGVFTVRSLEDAEKIGERVLPGRHAIVWGGGLVGLQMIQALFLKGMKVTGIVASDRILSRTLDVEASRLMKTFVEKQGIRIFLKRRVMEITKGFRGTLWVVLEDGKKIRGDLLIIAKGVEPRIELLKHAKIPFHHGISVDGHLQTSRENIYAAGDVVEFFDLIYEDRKINAIWPNAIDQGFVAGLNMSGSKVEYQGGIGMNVAELFGIKMASIGMIEAGNESRELIFSDPGKPAYKKVVLSHGRIRGAVFLGDISNIGLFHRLIKTRSGVADDNAKKLMTLSGDIPIAPIFLKYN